MSDREKLIETMARAMCDHDYKDTSAPFTSEIMWGYERIRIAYIARATAALTAIEAAGYRLVPVVPTPAMIEAHFEAHARAKTFFADVPDIWTAMLAAQEDSTSE